MSIYLGFDPGGAGEFGWCVAQESTESASGLPLIVVKAGIAMHAQEAVCEASHLIPGSALPAAAGIDAPLIWSRGVGRQSEPMLRQQMRNAGCKTAEGTVQHMNSLRGACVAQGMMTAVLLRERFKGIPLSEAHPKAWLWIAEVASQLSPVAEIAVSDLPEWCVSTQRQLHNHERDAAISCLSAWAMVHQPEGWHDLYQSEQQDGIYSPLEPPLAYWMPAPKLTQERAKRFCPSASKGEQQ